MTNFAQRLESAMDKKHITLSKLAGLTGIAKSSISQYLSGQNIPRDLKLEIIADKLSVSADWLKNGGGDSGTNSSFKFPAKIKVSQAARCMHKSENFVRNGIEKGIFPFGSVQKFSSKRTFYISPVQFCEYVGKEVFTQFFNN
ncbi:MAG: helix-turn-helix domain-containing protein [Oscillospiraceae bacterium]|jgi:transcriptional regulator with XRE-family HTH domain|nr:helix-turn-helix domain-containing protein [Oscillospiraceae bacterium]